MITSLGKKHTRTKRLFFFNYEMQAQVEFICQIKEQQGECRHNRLDRKSRNLSKRGIV
jgi:hypothetical protein